MTDCPCACHWSEDDGKAWHARPCCGEPTGSKLRQHKQRRQWADQYGSKWYLHYDGQPPHDDDQDYEWTGTQWVPLDERQATSSLTSNEPRG